MHVLFIGCHNHPSFTWLSVCFLCSVVYHCFLNITLFHTHLTQFLTIFVVRHQPTGGIYTWAVPGPAPTKLIDWMPLTAPTKNIFQNELFYWMPTFIYRSGGCPGLLPVMLRVCCHTDTHHSHTKVQHFSTNPCHRFSIIFFMCKAPLPIILIF